ncbi:MAG: glycerol-3-phosphate 1-O-acyltransferase PlsY [Gammaproteobacteria bacterium]|nr:glycerol-3-phosphate 1-O-acyltransferase PlsY [Gammaproteobacteria bacterium]
MSALIALIVAYLLGSVSSSIIISKVLKTPDPRTAGSGNAGATNVLRLSGKKQAALVLAGDMLKGLLAVWIGHILHVHGLDLGLVAFLAVVGHVYPVYFGFKGGKGVATAVGVVLGLSFISGILMAAAWATIAFLTRYSSLASILSVVLAPVFLLILSQSAYFFPAILIAALVIWKHKDNITRLQNKTETKIAF